MTDPDVKQLAADTMTKVRDAMGLFGDDERARTHCENIIILALLTAQANALSQKSRAFLASLEPRGKFDA